MSCILPPGDRLHEMSKPIFWENNKKYFRMSSVELFTQHAELNVLHYNAMMHRPVFFRIKRA